MASHEYLPGYPGNKSGPRSPALDSSVPDAFTESNNSFSRILTLNLTHCDATGESYLAISSLKPFVGAQYMQCSISMMAEGYVLRQVELFLILNRAGPCPDRARDSTRSVTRRPVRERTLGQIGNTPEIPR
eukprot:1470551-Rhodomonas_salina.1